MQRQDSKTTRNKYDLISHCHFKNGNLGIKKTIVSYRSTLVSLEDGELIHVCYGSNLFLVQKFSNRLIFFQFFFVDFIS